MHELHPLSVCWGQYDLPMLETGKMSHGEIFWNFAKLLGFECNKRKRRQQVKASSLRKADNIRQNTPSSHSIQWWRRHRRWMAAMMETFQHSVYTPVTTSTGWIIERFRPGSRPAGRWLTTPLLDVDGYGGAIGGPRIVNQFPWPGQFHQLAMFFFLRIVKRRTLTLNYDCSRNWLWTEYEILIPIVPGAVRIKGESILDSIDQRDWWKNQTCSI